MSNCAWFKCAQPFERTDPKQIFCTKRCQGADANWCAMRGKTVVRMLKDWRRSRHWSKGQVEAYVQEHGSLPLTRLQRRVDGWIAEDKNHIHDPKDEGARRDGT